MHLQAIEQRQAGLASGSGTSGVASGQTGRPTAREVELERQVKELQQRMEQMQSSIATPVDAQLRGELKAMRMEIQQLRQEIRQMRQENQETRLIFDIRESGKTRRPDDSTAATSTGNRKLPCHYSDLLTSE